MIKHSMVWTAASAALIGTVITWLQPDFRGRHAGRADQGYLESRDCVVCHSDHYASWARTFHSRMTREARLETVQGDFERDNTLDYLGVRARMEKRGKGLVMAMEFQDGTTRTFTVDRTVGSRRIEQYLTHLPGRYERLPVAYDLVNHRWMSLNGSFFHADGTNYFQQQALWDGNCVFCHNVKAQPHYSKNDKTFRTEVSELGVACGGCHGAAAEHAQAALSPFTRTAWRISKTRNKAIVNPLKIDSDRALMICGHCHGQRLPQPVDRIEELVTRGDPFNAGDDLNRFYRPIRKETTFGTVAFAGRFWPNGSPRLTAYEYQGVLRSKCFQQGEPGRRLNCLNCHVMHGGDPKGQITEENRGNRACLQCHSELADKEELAAHTGHRPESTGSRCYDCHMPRVVYGVMSVHPTHEITVPDPQLTATRGVPNACNQCHLDRSVNWSIRASRELWPRFFADARTSVDGQFDLPEGPRALFAGDAVSRALAAEALAGGGPGKLDDAFTRPYLIEALSDAYPIVRFFAANGLAHQTRTRPSGTPGSPQKPDYLADESDRRKVQQQWRERSSSEVAEKVAAMASLLRGRRVEVDVEVGE